MTRPDANSQRSAAPFAFNEAASVARYDRLRTQLPPDTHSAMPQFLAESGNPDQAVLQLEALLQKHPTEATSVFVSSALALRSCVLLFGASQWLGQALIQNPDLLQLFCRPTGLSSACLAEDWKQQFARFRSRFHELAFSILLARFKRREYVRIFLRELLGLASLAEITEEISLLSDILIEQALAHCKSELCRRYQGWPQLRSGDNRVYPARFAVLSLGKLGGNELNYSSDIDLLYICDDTGDAGTISIPAREFFTRLAQELTVVLSTVSSDGQVFRVDLRLRPQGSSGEMVVGCAQALRYYGSACHDWELQALLKLRPSAGDVSLAREFISQAQQLIYRDQLSLSVIQTAARSLERIQRGLVRQGARELDVKNGPGGLREIEFVVQCLQRVHGGREPWLRSGGTLPALQKLHAKGHIGDSEFLELCEAYLLLRAVEHRLQCRQGAPSHRLPSLTAEQAAIFRSLGEGSIRSSRELKRIMSSASKLCASVLRLGSVEGGEVAPASARLGSPAIERLTRELGACSAPIACALAADVGNIALRNLQRFLASASTDEKRIRTTLANVEWIERALPVFAQSALVTEILSRQPDDIGALFGKCDAPSTESSLSDRLRIEARRCVLRNAGSSLLEDASIWDVLGETSRCFDSIFQRALAATDVPDGFAIFAVGRLGTCELDVLSDADLVFLRSSECASEDAERCAMDLVSGLSGYTREGSVIAVDTRLRPHGRSGGLVTSTRQLAQYFESEAKAWETLAFSKLRWIAGETKLSAPVGEAVNRLRMRYCSAPSFVAQLKVMRKRLEESAAVESFKTGPGGLYDLDYLLGLLEARASLPAAGKQMRERLVAMVEGHYLSAEQGGALLQAADLYRRTDHAIRIVEGRSRRWLPESEESRRAVERITGVSALHGALCSEMPKVRSIFNSFFCD